MKKYLLLLLVLTFYETTKAQTQMDTYKQDGFTVSLPYYMSKTGGLNNLASIQYRNMIRGLAGYIVKEDKNVNVSDSTLGGINNYYHQFIQNFLTDKNERKVTAPKVQVIGETIFSESDLTYNDEETLINYYYFIGIAETSKAFYKVICFGTMDDRSQYKIDFQKILYSIKD
ncbi:hypothetical protein I5M32_13725 [Pedobacter sp. SD-b]|uniref:Secreted protein n=1 Tax=Pedobacter segetis TaxID=2793069 RepID=A0ABS1BMI9_9SPHI|nr:hypothetical protein [Pedobacter segetis]MBK0384023.1 hypothetical protein [Pedobacter segetis]